MPSSFFPPCTLLIFELHHCNNEGLACVLGENNKYGYIDKTGRLSNEDVPSGHILMYFKRIIVA
jgi:hypothetical protein